MLTRTCGQRKDDGTPCQATPMKDRALCFWHSPDHAQAATEARRLGGLRRAREHTVGGAYEVDGLASVAQVRRLLEIGVVDCLALDNSIARVRTLAYLATVALRLLEVGEYEARLAALEAVVTPPRLSGDLLFPGSDGVEVDEATIVFEEEEPR